MELKKKKSESRVLMPVGIYLFKHGSECNFDFVFRFFFINLTNSVKKIASFVWLKQKTK